MTTIIAKNEPSIFISHVFPNKADKVEGVFLELFGSCIDHVDIVKHKSSDGNDVCRAYVHFKFWPNTPTACSLREKLLKGDTVKVIYENPWFWKCVASKFNGNSESPKVTKGPYIEVDDEQIQRVVDEDDTVTHRPRGDQYRGHSRGDQYRGPPRDDYPRGHSRGDQYRGHPRDDYPRGDQYRGHSRGDQYRGHPRVNEGSSSDNEAPAMVPRQVKVRISKDKKTEGALKTSSWEDEDDIKEETKKETTEAGN